MSDGLRSRHGCQGFSRGGRKPVDPPCKNGRLQLAGRLHLAIGVLFRCAITVVIASVVGCFYTESINDRPSAEIQRDGSGEIVRGAELRFRAVLDDPNGDPLLIGWRAQACSAASVCQSIVTGVDPVFEFRVPGDVEGEPTVQVSIYLDVTDARGAVARPLQLLELPVANNAPSVTMQRRGRELSGNFPPGVPIVITAGGADVDRDSLALTWELFPARDSQPTDRSWRQLPDPPIDLEALIVEEYELIPDVAGEWIVQVTATDGIDEVVAARTMVVVPDQAPCLGATDPAPAAGARLFDRPRRVSVLVVEDDLDGFPWPLPGDPYLGAAAFRWSIRTSAAGGFVPFATGVSAVELDPAHFTPGDRLEVRVEVSDRTGRTVDCGPEPATCSALQNQCLQRQTWTLEVR